MAFLRIPPKTLAPFLNSDYLPALSIASGSSLILPTGANTTINKQSYVGGSPALLFVMGVQYATTHSGAVVDVSVNFYDDPPSAVLGIYTFCVGIHADGGAGSDSVAALTLPVEGPRAYFTIQNNEASSVLIDSLRISQLQHPANFGMASSALQTSNAILAIDGSSVAAGASLISYGDAWYGPAMLTVRSQYPAWQLEGWTDTSGFVGVTNQAAPNTLIGSWSQEDGHKTGTFFQTEVLINGPTSWLLYNTWTASQTFFINLEPKVDGLA